MKKTWFDNVIITTLKGREIARIDLSDAQESAFISNCNFTHSSARCGGYEYYSKDKRYYACVGKTSKYKYSAEFKDLFLEEYNRLKNKALVIAKKELESGCECRFRENFETNEEYLYISNIKLSEEDITDLKKEIEWFNNKISELEVAMNK